MANITELIRRLLDELDAALAPGTKPGEKLDLYHIGRSVLILHYGLRGLSTRDFDVVWMKSSPLEARAEKLFVRKMLKGTRINSCWRK